MSKLTITQVHSQIKCPKRQKDTLKALGLGRIGSRPGRGGDEQEAQQRAEGRPA